MWDTIPIVSYSKDTIVVTNKMSDTVIWHRIPNKIAKKYKPKPEGEKGLTSNRKSSHNSRENELWDGILLFCDRLSFKLIKPL